jgi:hypothetical protein
LRRAADTMLDTLRENYMNRPLSTVALAAWLICVAAPVRADDAPPRTKHQMMKDCMAKQKASDGGMPKEQMKKNCRDVTKTEKENATTDKENAAADKENAAQSATPSKPDHP